MNDTAKYALTNQVYDNSGPSYSLLDSFSFVYNQTVFQGWTSASLYTRLDGSYAGTIITTTVNNNVYKGEWLQAYVPQGTQISFYVINSYLPPANLGIAPYSWVLLGSTDATNWELLDTQTTTRLYQVSVAKFEPQIKKTYNYFRFVFTSAMNHFSFYSDDTFPLYGAIPSIYVQSIGIYHEM